MEALEAAPDFEIAGIVRRNGAENKPAELEPYAVVKDIKELNDVDVAILATPTRSVEKYAKEILAMGINTVVLISIHRLPHCAVRWTNRPKQAMLLPLFRQDGIREVTR